MTSPFASPWWRRARHGMLALCALTAACQVDDGLTTVPTTPPTNPADSILRVLWTLPPTASFGSDTVRVVVRGPTELRQGRISLRDASTKQVLYLGASRGLRGKQDTVTLPLSLAELTSGLRFEAVAEVRTASGGIFYSAGVDSTVSDQADALAGPTSIFYSGRGITLQGQTLGGMAIDPLRGWLLISLADRNRLIGLNAASQQLLPWSATTGATPGRVVYHPTAWGPSGTAVVLNTGGSDLSVIDVDGTGARERRRIAMPSLIYRFGGDSTSLYPRALRATVACLTAPCSLPQMLVSVGEPTGRAGLLVVQPATGQVTGGLLPETSGSAPDTPIRTMVSAQLAPGLFTTLASSETASRCSADRLGNAWFGQSQRAGIPSALLMLIPDVPAACTGTGRLQRWEPGNGLWRPSAATSSLTAGQNAAPASGISDVAFAEDGSHIATVSTGRVGVFRNDGSHVGNIPTAGETLTAFLHDEFGTPVSLAVFTDGVITFYQPATLAFQTSVTPPPGVNRTLRVIPTGGSQFLLVTGGNQPARLWMLPMTLSSLGTMSATRPLPLEN